MRLRSVSDPGARPGLHPAASSAIPWLAWAYLALVVYATWYPLDDWKGLSRWENWQWLWLPWPRWYGLWDDWANFLGYAPLGALMALSAVRRHQGRGQLSWGPYVGAALAASVLSYSLELGQLFIPQRVASARDWALNSAGAAMGTAISAWLVGSGQLRRWLGWRHRMVDPDAGTGLALMAIWPMTLLLPLPIPLGLGQWLQSAQALLSDGCLSVPAFEACAQWLAPREGRPLAPGGEALAALCFLWGPMALSLSLLHRGWSRLWALLGVPVVGFAMTSLSSSLSFGPAQALSWLTPPVILGWGLALALGLFCLALSGRLLAVLSLVGLVLGLTLLAQAPEDPYFTANLRDWEQGRFFRFHGATRYLAGMWPYAAVVWLVAWIGRRR